VSRTIMLVPLESGVGVTCVSLGLFRALERHGMPVNFFKPVAQPKPGDTGPERSTVIIRSATSITPPEPFSMAEAESLISHDRMSDLLENIVERFKMGTVGAEVVVVEGLVPNVHHPFTNELNHQIATALGAEIVLVTHPGMDTVQQLREHMEMAMTVFGGADNKNLIGCIINKVGVPLDDQSLARPDADEVFASTGAKYAHPYPHNSGLDVLQMFGNSPLPVLGCVPWSHALAAPRVGDLARHLHASIINAGDIDERRVLNITFCARSVPTMVHNFRPGAMLVTSGDRPDVVTAVCLAAMNGVKLACLVLTGGFGLDHSLRQLCERAMVSTGLPIILVETDTWETSLRLQSFDQVIPADDKERIELVQDYFAGYVDKHWVASLTQDSTLSRKLSPPAFRYHLTELARQVNHRIVLPEGEEPRTVKAAVQCAQRGIATPVLLGDPQMIRLVAEQQGLILGDGVQIVNPVMVREQYVGPMVKLRKDKGLIKQMASEQLEDNVVLGTMMLALDEVDGLVSGAVHTTANTIRPALQLIKTAPEARLVSSIFFMLLPDQVLVYGDCAINPDPSAQELADIAIQSAESARAFGIEPRVAMISYSTGSSGTGTDVDKVREATQIAQERCPELVIDGPLQYDAAIMENVAKSKAPDSPVAGKATVFVFPDLNTGNTTYKAVQRSADLVSIGPMLQGIRKPVNDLSRGALVDDIVYTIALTAIQATQAQRR
jgi:phosphate acetyltransferase